LRLAIGSVFESAGRDEQALAECLEAKRIATNNLLPNHPINATINSAVGTVYAHLSQFDLAADHFLKALDLREQILGPKHVDTGLVLNNIGCCLHCLDRTEDALQMYYRAQEIFALQFALEHPRYVTVRRNIQRSKTCYLKNSQFTVPQHKPYKAPYNPGAIRSKAYMQKLEGKKGRK
jgi:serine/threonine-protein kinase